jgi:aspartate-semialdehyde dehydrogenase
MSNRKYNVAVVGATGLVGRTMIKVLEERNFPVNELKLLASVRSAGTKAMFNNEEITVQELTGESFKGVDIALFSAGGSISLTYAPIAASYKCIVIDNSSAWRMDPEIPLVVPEVNPEVLRHHKYIIANPNCSTIQLVVPLKALQDEYGLKRVICSTYQSISGAGQKGVDKLMTEIKGGDYDNKIKYAFNTAFHPFDDNGFTNEENKMVNETRKILGINDLKIAVTCVRVPTLGGHSESVNIELNNPFEIHDIKKLMANTAGMILMDNPSENIYPYPLLTADKDPVYVGRIRRDDTVENGLYLWVVADNLRKGAATNAVQIAEKMVEMGIV